MDSRANERSGSFRTWDVLMSVDAHLWTPSANIETLRARAQAMAEVRRFFVDRAYLEVETPIMARFGVSDPYLQNIKAYFRAQAYCLQTSPEYHMKRLLAAGSGPIFQIARVFRDDEFGRWHNPEFSLLEWYKLAVDHHVLMDEVETFLQFMLDCPNMMRMSYQEAFQAACGLCPLQDSLADLKACLSAHDLGNVFDSSETDRDQHLFLLMSHVVEPYLARLNVPVAVYDFPVSQASLAKAHGLVAARFEVYYQGVELANGFNELTDAQSQLQRFNLDNQQRQSLGFETVPEDVYLLEALKHGMPACSGVALGLERLLALRFGFNQIAPTMAFAFERA